MRLLSTLCVLWLACATPAPFPVDPRPPTAPLVRDLCIRYAADRGALGRFYDLAGAPERDERLRRFHDESRAALERVDFDALSVDDRIDWLLLNNRIDADAHRLAFERARALEYAPLVPFAGRIVALHRELRTQNFVEPEREAGDLEDLKREIEASRTAAEAHPTVCSPVVARRAARYLDELNETLGEWYRFRADYDPLFTWWARKPREAAGKALEDYTRYVRETIAGDKQDDTSGRIVGDPIGREELEHELRLAWIPYSPEELIEIADREMRWCTERMIESARALGLGDDWKAALERVKRAHVAPGEQPALVRDLALSAIEFLKQHDLVTVPPLCEETWRMSMLSADAQRTAPFFLGGEEIQVAFPTASMTHAEKLMSMRGNNRHFAHATVFHELIPGHGLQQYYQSRWNTHRGQFSTPFWTEGWALYWEMLLWDRGFHATPEDRIGALFWRMHRCARIRFSLGFHLGTLTPEQCVDYLVDAVGHEQKNAEAEVRRSVTGGYGPLYQCAYMIGGLQIRALHRELVGSKQLTDRAFHDAILEGNNIPIEMVRARLMNTRLEQDAVTTWRFYDL
ncbi:MAG: DUF885 family protein [Planctomycetes bacterium]|nr:DUF885 family protein [Planctomycetota bacterium]